MPVDGAVEVVDHAIGVGVVRRVGARYGRRRRQERRPQEEQRRRPAGMVQRGAVVVVGLSSYLQIPSCSSFSSPDIFLFCLCSSDLQGLWEANIHG